MARTFDIISPPERTSDLQEVLGRLPHLVNLRLVRGASVTPPGDVLSVTVPNSTLQELMRVLDGFGLGKPGGVSLSSSSPDSVISPSLHIDRDALEATWEEMEMIIGTDSNATGSTLLLMGLAGALATAGIATSSLHIVIAGMLVAPGFMPISRIALGLVSGSRVWRRAVVDVAKCYASLMAASALASVSLRALGHDPLRATVSYHEMADPFVTYWTTVTGPGLFSSALASVAGAALLSTQRSIFTSGVMIGLALVPSAALIGVALAAGQLSVAQEALSRLSADLALVLVLSVLYFWALRTWRHRRRMH